MTFRQPGSAVLPETEPSSEISRLNKKLEDGQSQKKKKEDNVSQSVHSVRKYLIDYH